MFSSLGQTAQQFGQQFGLKFSSLGQTAEQFGETADQTAEQFCLETLFFYWILFDFLLIFNFLFSLVFCSKKNQEYEKETTEQFPSYAAFET